MGPCQLPAVSGSSHNDTSGQVGSSTSASDQSRPANSSPCGPTIGAGRNDPMEVGRGHYDAKDVEQATPSGRTLHLLFCTERGRHAVCLHQDNVTNVTDDQDLFRTLRQLYRGHRGRLRPYWSLRTISSIHFMKVRWSLMGNNRKAILIH
jgi:hypothetical protein